MDVFRRIAEKRIRDAFDKGELDNLKNAGHPIKFDDDSFIPEELRLSYKVLKNAGCIPPELQLRNEILSMRSLISQVDDDIEKLEKLRELNFKILKLNEMRGKDIKLDEFPDYEQKIFEKML